MVPVEPISSKTIRQLIPEDPKAALALLTERFFHPVHRFVLSKQPAKGFKAQDAWDIAQGAFLRICEDPEYLKRANSKPGSLRSYVFATVSHTIDNLIRHELAGKRRPDGPVISLDQTPSLAPEGGMRVDDDFDSHWYRSIIDDAYQKLSRKSAGGKIPLYAAFRAWLSETPIDQTCESLGCTPAVLSNWTWRGKRVWSEWVRQRIREYAEPDEVEGELAELVRHLEKSEDLLAPLLRIRIEKGEPSLE
jgi:hypothetical protein